MARSQTKREASAFQKLLRGKAKNSKKRSRVFNSKRAY